MVKKELFWVVLGSLFYTFLLTLPMLFLRGNRVAETRSKAADTGQVYAFPGAEGFGANTIGGRGGKVIHVTNLNDSGSGSLREALSASGARIVVFDLGGTIILSNDIYINNPYITIAGQTATGDGITIRNGGIYIKTHDVIIRSLRIRVGAESSGAGNERHGINILGNESHNPYAAYNIIIDHCSLSWATDEDLSFYGGVNNVTVQWSIISETLMNSIQPKGAHSMGMLFNEYTNNISIHHNLFAHNYYRNPLIQGLASAEVVNNVIYNWGWEGTYFCNSSIGGPLYANVIGNKYISGVDSRNRGIMIWDDVVNGSKVYVKGNEGPGREDVNVGNECDAVTERKTGICTSSSPAISLSGVNTEGVHDAYQKVISNVGAIAPKRDAYDNRIINDVKNKTGKVIDSPSQVGGWLTFNSGTVRTDSDRDGMPDEWERSVGLNPNNASDGNSVSSNGYTWIEVYLNSLISGSSIIPTLTPTVSIPNPTSTLTPTPTKTPTPTPTKTPTPTPTVSQNFIIDHNSTKLNLIPASAIQNAKSSLHIAYGHSSHGSQITDGMTGLVKFKGSLYQWNSGGSGGALDLRNTPFSGAEDLGNPNRIAWIQATKNYIAAHSDINVIMWSWCGQVASSSEADINSYLQGMSTLERDYPKIKFVYMTGHLDGSGTSGNLHKRNEQIRAYCRANNKILYDFADIESYDPDGSYFLDKGADDGCNYNGGNWAINWQDKHPGEWYDCVSAHSQPLNANLKAYAAWWMFARMSGWNGSQTPTAVPTIKPTATATPKPNPTATPTKVQICTNGTTECVSTTQSRTCVNNEWVNTFCNSVQTCLNGVCQLKTQSAATLNIKIAFAGVKPANSQCAVNWPIIFKVVNESGNGISGGEFTAIPQKTTEVNNKGEMIYIFSGAVSNIPDSHLGSAFIKGPKHISIKYGSDGQQTWYSQLKGSLNILAGTNNYNFSEYPILTGDVTGSTTGVPDNKIDGRDFSYIKEKASKLTSGSVGTNVDGDLDGNCQVNSGDVSLVKKSLTEINGQTY